MQVDQYRNVAIVNETRFMLLLHPMIFSFGQVNPKINNCWLKAIQILMKQLRIRNRRQ